MSQSEEPQDIVEDAAPVEVEEETAFLQKEITLTVEENGEVADGSAVEEEEKSAQPADDDRTEDQVPDITGTENIDPMTTSMDGIEELPANEEAQDYGDTIYEEEEDYHYDAAHDVLIASDNSAYSDYEVAEESAPAAEPEPSAAEESAPEVEPVEEAHTEDATAPEAEPADEEVPPAEEVPVEAEPEAVQEEAAEEPAVVPEETEAAPADAEPEPAAEEVAAPDETPATPAAEEKEFELQAPPEGKRPRTPNELDNPADEEFVDAPEELPVEEASPATPAAEALQTPKSEVPPTPKSAISAAPEEAPSTPRSAAPTTPRSTVPDEVPQTPKSTVTSVPPTPRSAAGSVPPTPKSAVANGSICNGSIPGTPKTPLSAKPESVKTETPKATPTATPAAEPTPKATGTPKSAKVFNFEETPATPKADSVVTFDEAIPTPTTAKTPKTPRTPRTPRTPKTPKTPVVAEPAPEPEPEPEPVVEETAPEPEPEGEVVEETSVPEPEPEPEAQEEATPTDEPEATLEEAITEEPAPEPVDENKIAAEETAETQPARAASPSPPPRARRASPSPPPRPRRQSPSPERRREAPAREHVTYDQDSFRQVPPPRIPTASSFSSWTPVDKPSYQAISPFVSNPHKYRNEYTTGSSYRPSNLYTSHFDDIVATGAFSSALYSTNRLIERSRSRTRERRQAMRSQRSASNYYKYTSQYPAPQRTREYSTPPSRNVSRAPSRSGSFISFMDYSAAKNGELSRAGSRSSIYDGLSRSGSRANVDLYLGSGRLSRVDSYVRDINTPYEYEVPSTYERYRSASRPGAYSNLSAYSPSPYLEDSRHKRYQADVSMVRSMYETRIGHLERSLSRERLNKDRPYYAGELTAPRTPAVSSINRLYFGYARDWAPY